MASELKCSECDADIPIPNDSMSGEIVICPDCGQSWELELMSGKNDFILKKAEAQAEDWGQ